VQFLSSVLLIPSECRPVAFAAFATEMPFVLAGAAALVRLEIAHDATISVALSSEPHPALALGSLPPLFMAWSELASPIIRLAGALKALLGSAALGTLVTMRSFSSASRLVAALCGFTFAAPRTRCPRLKPLARPSFATPGLTWPRPGRSVVRIIAAETLRLITAAGFPHVVTTTELRTPLRPMSARALRTGRALIGWVALPTAARALGGALPGTPLLGELGAARSATPTLGAEAVIASTARLAPCRGFSRFVVH
jgi:hypothetical protein